MTVPLSVLDLSPIPSGRRFVSVGTPERLREDLERRRSHADADELIITTQVHDPAERQLSYELIAKAYAG